MSWKEIFGKLKNNSYAQNSQNSQNSISRVKNQSFENNENNENRNIKLKVDIPGGDSKKNMGDFKEFIPTEQNDQYTQNSPLSLEELAFYVSEAEKVSLNRLKPSEALEAAAEILEDKDVKLKKHERREGERMGKEIKLALMATPKDLRVQAVRDAASIMALNEGGTPISSGDLWDLMEPGGQREEVPEYCPARCKKTDLCFGKTYFRGKPGRGVECLPRDCRYKEQLILWHERKNADE